MTPHAFIAKWRASELKERSASQEHFLDLCRLLGEPTPAEADPTGQTYCFERGARKDTGGDGWADGWKRHHFAREYKGRIDAVSTVIRNRVNLNRWSTTTSWGSGVGHRQTRASLDGVRGAGVKAVSPAKAGAERSDAP